MGDFDGIEGVSAAAAHSVLDYLWFHTARTEMDGQLIGWVLDTKANYPDMASETGLNMRTARRVVTWFSENGWVWKLTDQKSGNKMSIKVLMDEASHYARIGDHTLRTPCPEGTDTMSVGSGHDVRTIQGFQGLQGNSEENYHEDQNGERESQSNAVGDTTSRVGEVSGQGVPSAESRSDIASGTEYIFWQKDGVWRAFPAATAKRSPRSARRVTLSEAEIAFYNQAFGLDGACNDRRVSFLQSSAGERSALMASVVELPQADDAAASVDVMPDAPALTVPPASPVLPEVLPKKTHAELMADARAKAAAKREAEEVANPALKELRDSFKAA